MILNHNTLPENLKKGMEELEKKGFLKLGEAGVIIKSALANSITIQKSEQEIMITYDTEPHFYMALGRSMGMKNGSQKIEPKVRKLGLMLDCSRNAVATPDMVKRLISLLVLSGYNYLELYTEETYELPGEPYFGYKRGRYSAEELKEIVTFADIFGFEMVPCIQTLAHLKNLANWGVYYDHMDIDDILLVGDERTYDLIHKMLKFCKEVFRTKRINIGTDEAFRLGQGKYKEINGYRSKHTIYLEHLQRVFQMCKEEGLEPEFWGDAFYDIECSPEEVQVLFDGTQTPIYYDYDVNSKEKHSNMMKKLKEYAGRVMYGGGCWKWIGFAPDNAYTERAIDPAFEAVEECGIDNILMTTWGDGGDECSVYTVISSMWYASQKLYPCDADVNKIVKVLTGYTTDEWKCCDRLNHVMPYTGRMSNAVKYLLYNDFLIGLMDHHIPDHAGEVYKELFGEFDVLAQRNSQFSYIFESYAALCRVLIHKATYSKQLYQAYQNKDNEVIKSLMEELQNIREDVEVFHTAFRKYWLTENKGFGLEISDTRIGGIIPRIDTVTAMLRDYLEGRVEKIYELEEERIGYWCNRFLEDDVYEPIHNDWWTAYTVNCFRM